MKTNITESLRVRSDTMSRPFRRLMTGLLWAVCWGVLTPLQDAHAQDTCLESLATLSSAQVWVGLKNSEAVGLRLDLKAEVFLGGVKISEGQLNNVASGRSGFNNAKENTIPLTPATPVGLLENAELEMTLSVRRTCSGGGPNSGTPRLWFNDSQADSRFGATIEGTTFFLRDAFALTTDSGAGLKKTIDVFVDSNVACPNRPFTPFGTWRMTLPCEGPKICPTTFTALPFWFESAPPFEQVSEIRFVATFTNASGIPLTFSPELYLGTFQLWTGAVPNVIELTPRIMSQPDGTVQPGQPFTYDLIVDVSTLPSTETRLAFRPVTETPFGTPFPSIVPLANVVFTCE